MRLLSRFCLLFTLLMLAGCTVAPKPVYRTYPVEGSGIWKNGVELAEARGPALRAAMVSHAQNPRRLTYYVEVENLCDGLVTVDPARFTLRHGPSFEAPDSLFCRPIAAVDPEKARLQTDLNRSTHVARLEGHRNTETLFGVVDLAADIADAGKTRTEEEKQTRELEEQNDREYREGLEKRYRVAVASGSGPLYPPDGRLRKTTLLPGESVGGLVSFPVHKPAAALLFEIPADGGNLVIPYRLETHYPAGARRRSQAGHPYPGSVHGRDHGEKDGS